MMQSARGVAARVAAWRDSEHRSRANELGADRDRLAFLLTTFGSTFLLVCKTWIREGLPGLALLASTHSLLAGAFACLVSHRRWGRQFYVSRRELFLAAIFLHMQWVVRLTALHGGVNTMDHHGGSVLGLLGLLGGHTTVLYGTMYAISARPPWPASGALLALMAVTSLWNGERMCHRVLEAPGVEAPLSELTALLTLTHAASSPFYGSLAGPQSATPMQQCQALSVWLVLAAGLALPSALLWKMEGQARKEARRQDQRQQRPGEVHAAGDEEPPGGATRGEQEAGRKLCAVASEEEAGWKLFAVELYLASSCIWLAACIAVS